MIDDLMGVSPAQLALDDTGEHDQRRALLHRVGDAVDAIGEAGTERRHQQAGTRGVDTGAGRHHRGGRLIACQHEVDARALERIHKRDHFAARHAKGMAHARSMQRGGNSISDTVGV